MTEVRPDFLPAMGTPGLLPFYDRFGRIAGMGEYYWQLVAQAAIPAGATVLDVGCGTGEIALRAARSVPRVTVTGVDPDVDGVALARRKAADQGLTVRFEQAYAQHLPMPDAGVDRVLSSLMFHHLPDDAKPAMLAEVLRVLTPGGSLHILDIDGDRPEWSGWLKPVRAVFGVAQRIGAGGRGGHGHGHGHGGHSGHAGHGGANNGHGTHNGDGDGVDHSDPAPEQGGHGHAGHADSPAHGTAESVVRLLTAAGFAEVEVVGRAVAGMGGLVFYRAVRPVM